MVEKEILDNGLRVILIPNQATNVLSAMVMFGVGSRYESDELAGISHILEHMSYKGTSRRPTPIEVAEAIESVGGEHNAFTGKEYTGYYTKVAPRHLETALDFLSDILLNSNYHESDLEREKGVIIEEVNMYEDTPMDLVGNKFEEALFGANALGRDVIGTKETISAVTRADLVSYRQSHYTGPNTTLVLAGNFGSRTPADLMRLITKYFAFAGKTSVDLSPLTFAEKKSSKIITKKTEQSHLVLGFYGAPFAHPDLYKLKLLAVILGGSMSSRMFIEIREKRGLAYAVRTTANGYSDTGTIETQIGVPHNKVAETIKAVLAEYRKIKQESVGEAELKKAKEIALGRMLISFEDSLNLAMHYATGETIAREVVTPEELARLFEKISSRDIMDTAKKYLRDDRMALAYIGPSLSQVELEPIFTL
ncbi:MAG: pitrilysin family protein [Patescibacteria group bacterium]